MHMPISRHPLQDLWCGGPDPAGHGTSDLINRKGFRAVPSLPTILSGMSSQSMQHMCNGMQDYLIITKESFHSNGLHMGSLKERGPEGKPI